MPITGKIWHFLVQEISRIHTGLLKDPLNLLYQGNLNYSYAFPTIG